MKSYGKFTLGLIIVWFVFALSAAAANLFRNDAERVGISIALAAGIPVLAFLAWSAASPRFRAFTRTLDPGVLTGLQSSRILGFVFVLLEAHHRLPALFALPAGYGDMFIGFTATFVAWKVANLRHRAAFIAWQALGMIDLVAAVSLGTSVRLLFPGGTTMLPMTVLPLSLVPTFLVPLFLILHIVCIAQAISWKTPSGVAGYSARASLSR